jgi:hypothetical protein
MGKIGEAESGSGLKSGLELELQKRRWTFTRRNEQRKVEQTY